MIPRFLAELLNFYFEIAFVIRILKGFNKIMWKETKSDESISTIHNGVFFHQKSTEFTSGYKRC